MTKEEILEKSRREQDDEGVREAEVRGQTIGIKAFCAMEIIIILFNLFNGQSNYVPFTLLWSFVAGEAYPKYRFTGKRSYLLSTIAGGIAAVVFCVCHVLEVLC